MHRPRQVLQVRNSGTARPGGFCGFGSGSLVRLHSGWLQREHPAEQSSMRLAGRSFFSVCSFPCGFSTWTIVDFLQHAASDILVGNSRLLTQVSKEMSRSCMAFCSLALEATTWPSTAFCLGGSHEGLPTFKRKEHRLCHLIGD